MVKKSLCDRCTGLCCRYFALPIETPETRGDYDDIRWYLCHEAVSVFVEEGDWYINIQNRCRKLDKGNRCTLYTQRPRLCRDYSEASCDFVEGEYDYELLFTDDQQMAEYIKIKFDNTREEKRSKREKGQKQR